MIAEGLLAGTHKSLAHGFNVEFLEHRRYYPGDDIRHIDWKAYARTGQTHIKTHEDEKTLRVCLFVDASASMGIGSETAAGSKYEYASVMASALAYMLLRQGDRVSLTLSGGSGSGVQPGNTTAHMQRILEALATCQPDGRADNARDLRHACEAEGSRAVFLIFSDLLTGIDAFRAALRVLRGRGDEVAIFHITDEAEEVFPFSKASKFIDPETGAAVETDPLSIREKYLSSFAKFRTGYSDFCMATGIDYMPSCSGRPPEMALMEYLTKREAAGRKSARR